MQSSEDQVQITYRPQVNGESQDGQTTDSGEDVGEDLRGGCI